jgi:integral membrane protein
MFNNAVSRLRLISFIEGISTLALFLIAMPLKYLAGKPEAVTHVGRIHGGLVIVFCIALLLAKRERGWQSAKAVILFAFSLVPFGFLWIEKDLKREPVS